MCLSPKEVERLRTNTKPSRGAEFHSQDIESLTPSGVEKPVARVVASHALYTNVCKFVLVNRNTSALTFFQ
jgi:hypothetical protein